MFADIEAKTREWREQRRAWAIQNAAARANARARVYYLADQVYLASYHQRPQAEIDKLLAELRVATEQRDH